jgi:ribosomal protein S18 acetylase RimI-like enzyme
MPATRAAVHVRTATPDDLAVIVELRLALVAEHADDIIYGRPRRDIRARARQLYLAQLRSTREITFLAEKDGAAVGILRCVDSAGHPLLHPDRYGYISSVYVRESARRHGVLRILMQAAERWCRDRGLRELRLHNAATNPLSNATWDALGFEIAEHLRIRPLPPEE